MPLGVPIFVPETAKGGWAVRSIGTPFSPPPAAPYRSTVRIRAATLVPGTRRSSR